MCALVVEAASRHVPQQECLNQFIPLQCQAVVLRGATAGGWWWGSVFRRVVCPTRRPQGRTHAAWAAGQREGQPAGGQEGEQVR